MSHHDISGSGADESSECVDHRMESTMDYS